MDPFRTTNVNFAESMGFELGSAHSPIWSLVLVSCDFQAVVVYRESSPSISRGEGDISMQRRAYVGPKRPDPQQHSQQGGRSHGLGNYKNKKGDTSLNYIFQFLLMFKFLFREWIDRA